MKTKTVPFDLCVCGKRGWRDERDAEKALGRAQAKRNRTYGNRRGLVRESRYYQCEVGDLLHLTHMSRRQHHSNQIGASA